MKRKVANGSIVYYDGKQGDLALKLLGLPIMQVSKGHIIFIPSKSRVKDKY